MCAAADFGGCKTIADDAAAGGHARPQIGVYGMGEIGRKIAARVGELRNRGRLFQPQQARRAVSIFSEPGSARGMVQRADDRSSGAGNDTDHAVDANILKKLGNDGYVVNISRGSVIDQQALVAALTDQTIAGAGLDVYAKKPHAPMRSPRCPTSC